MALVLEATKSAAGTQIRHPDGADDVGDSGSDRPDGDKEDGTAGEERAQTDEQADREECDAFPH
ncbi:MAG: hypothetical protein E6K14_04100 [Methanobacteriota archaeon]|nr:MAG: hypothetical protein E6K14_04100 [Euryarchaeota archaeon]